MLEDRRLLSSYTITNLGNFGGPYSNATGINNAGEVVGTSYTTRHYSIWEYNEWGERYQVNIYNQPLAYTWVPTVPNGTSGTLTKIGTLGGTESAATAINSSGQVVGGASLVGDTAGHAFLYSGGTMHDLGVPPGGTSSGALGINANGQVVGSFSLSDGTTHAFLWTPTTPNGTSGTFSDLGTVPGTTFSEAEGISDSGQIVGTSYVLYRAPAYAFLYTGGQMTILGTAPFGDAHAINKSGEVVGESDSLYSGGQTYDLGALSGGANTALAINTPGQVVGWSYSSTNSQDAFLWSPTTPNGTTGTMIDLNIFIGKSHFSGLPAADGINDQGQIVGYGLVKGQEDSFVLTPSSASAAVSSTTAASSSAGATSPSGTIRSSALTSTLIAKPSTPASVGPTFGIAPLESLPLASLSPPGSLAYVIDSMLSPDQGPSTAAPYEALDLGVANLVAHRHRRR
jgi:probable HAF family extracellular repeat protein